MRDMEHSTRVTAGLLLCVTGAARHFTVRVLAAQPMLVHAGTKVAEGVVRLLDWSKSSGLDARSSRCSPQRQRSNLMEPGVGREYRVRARR